MCRGGQPASPKEAEDGPCRLTHAHEACVGYRSEVLDVLPAGDGERNGLSDFSANRELLALNRPERLVELTNCRCLLSVMQIMLSPAGIETLTLGVPEGYAERMNKQPLIRKTFSVPPLGCNCSILGDPLTKEAVIVDPGGDHHQILRYVEEMGLAVVRVIHTHAHFDHFLASDEIRKATGAALCLHAEDRVLWEGLEIQCRLFGVPYVPVPAADYWLRDEAEISVGRVQGVAFHTPGHTPGSMCFHFPEDQLLFAGDTLFRGGIGRTDLWGGSHDAIERSIRERLYTLEETTKVVPGHGPETEIGWERESNPFVRG